jgi:transcriptional regulator with XRE-family HTH domain
LCPAGYPARMPAAISPFGCLVNKLLADRGLSQRAFATKVGLKQPHVAQLIGGRWPMPEARIATWIEALSLTGPEAEEFRIEALLTRCPMEIRELVVRLRGSQKKRQPR